MFFELVKMETTSFNKGFNLNFDTSITKREKEVSKRRTDVFFRLKQGVFVAFADGVDKKVQFKLQTILKELPKNNTPYSNENLRLNFERIYKEVSMCFKRKNKHY